MTLSLLAPPAPLGPATMHRKSAADPSAPKSVMMLRAVLGEVVLGEDLMRINI
ncbi:hypothetical protein [Profundibacter sp.]